MCVCIDLVSTSLPHPPPFSPHSLQANVDQCGGTHGRSALHYAAYHGHTETVRVLVDHRANMELKDIEGNTAMNLCTQADVLHLLSKEVCMCVSEGGWRRRE